jgi:PhnB protein
MRINTHLSFNGQCEAAFKLYAECLSGEITMMLTYGGSPLAATAPELGDKILHATLKLGDYVLTGADVPPNRYEKPQGFAVQLNIDNPGQAEAIFNTLLEGGTVQFPLQRTFWAERYGIVPIDSARRGRSTQRPQPDIQPWRVSSEREPRRAILPKSGGATWLCG